MAYFNIFSAMSSLNNKILHSWVSTKIHDCLEWPYNNFHEWWSWAFCYFGFLEEKLKRLKRHGRQYGELGVGWSKAELVSGCHKTKALAEANVRSTLFVKALSLLRKFSHEEHEPIKEDLSHGSILIFADFLHLVHFMMILILKLKY